MSVETAQFDNLGKDYAKFVATDPLRNDLHYPAVMKKFLNLKNIRLLDIGCGDGNLSRLLAKENNAQIVAFDIAPHLIEIAQQLEMTNSLGIQYAISDQISFYIKEDPCDYAITVMVLPYAKDLDDLKEFFACAYRNSKTKSEFYSVVFNPSFREFGRVIANRRFVQLKDSKVQVNFLDPKSKVAQFTSLLTQYSQADYETAAKLAGFDQVVWEKMLPTPQGLAKLGEEFWKDCIVTQPYSLLISTKS